MESGHALIDKAVEKCGSRYKLSKLTGIAQSNLSVYYSGKKALSPVAAAKIAEVAGLDARNAAIVAIIEGEHDAEARALLRRVFSHATSAAMLLFFIVAALIAPSPTLAKSGQSSQGHRSTCTDTQGIYIM